MPRTALFSRNQPGGVWTISDLVSHPGDIWFVNSGAAAASDSAGFGQNPDAPFATLDYAVGKCTANNGDVIYVMPGHAENLIAAATVDIDVAGVTVIGLGKGAARPTFTATVAAGAFKLNAASVRIENLLFLGGVDATTGLVRVVGADCAIINCEYRDSVGQATDVIITTAAADRLLIDGWRHIGDAAAGTDTAIALVGGSDIEIRNFYLYGNFAVGGISVRTTATTRLNLHDGYIWNANAVVIGIIDTITGSTGWIGPNLRIKILTDAANITAAVTGATFQMVDPVYIINAVAQKAMLSTWTAVTNA